MRTRSDDEDAYLGSADPRAQSGFRGDDARWERARRPILEALDEPGTLLDVGCANGYLMESLHRWSGGAVEPYGLDVSARLVELARERLPHWRDRIYAGDVLEWEPPRRFDYVRSELVYAPKERRGHLVDALLRLCAPGGRVIVCSYGSRNSGPRLEPLGEWLRELGHDPVLEYDRDEPQGALLRVAVLGVPSTS